jgi:hypothetical protein
VHAPYPYVTIKNKNISFELCLETEDFNIATINYKIRRVVVRRIEKENENKIKIKASVSSFSSSFEFEEQDEDMARAGAAHPIREMQTEQCKSGIEIDGKTKILEMRDQPRAVNREPR